MSKNETKLSNRLIELRISDMECNTQEALACSLKVDVRTIQRWESGTIIPSKGNLSRIANHFNIDTNELIELAKESKASSEGENLIEEESFDKQEIVSSNIIQLPPKSLREIQFEQYLEEEKRRSGLIEPKVKVDLKNMIEFGFFPQSLASEKELKKIQKYINKNKYLLDEMEEFNIVDSSQNSIKLRHYFKFLDIEVDKQKYRGIIFNNYRPLKTSYLESEEISVQKYNGFVKNELYWFKFEPIKWFKVEMEKESYLISDLILDSHEYNPLRTFGDDEIIELEGNSSSYELFLYQFSKKAFSSEDIGNTMEFVSKRNITLLDEEFIAMLCDEVRTYEFCDKLLKPKHTSYSEAKGLKVVNNQAFWWISSFYPIPDNATSLSIGELKIKLGGCGFSNITNYVNPKGEIRELKEFSTDEDLYLDSYACTYVGFRPIIKIKKH